MTAFTFGMIAAALWAGVIVAMWLIQRRSPGHPFRSIGQFRRARKRLMAQPADPQPARPDPTLFGDISETVDEPELVPAAIDPGGLPDPPASAGEPPIDATDEIEEIQAVITLISDPERRAKKSAPAKRKPRKRVAAASRKGPRKVGRITYVLVDEDGRPETDL